MHPLRSLVRQILLEYKNISRELVIEWLIEHYSDKRKLPEFRIDPLLEMKKEFSFLAPPDGKRIYRGLSNVTENGVEKLEAESETDPVMDKSWSMSKSAAWKFARAEWSTDDREPEKFAVVIVAEADPDRMLLNWKKISEIEEIADFVHEDWDEKLYQSIVDEQEVVVSGPMKIVDLKVEKNPDKIKPST